jgi:hypothetical protein
VSKGQLTRQELTWLLTQEAQGAAAKLRSGVSILRTSMPPAMAEVAFRTALPKAETSLSGGQDPAQLDATLDVLDDAMNLLTSLHQHTSQSRGRRGRIDVVSIIWGLYPNAKLAIEPGAGTEVYADEADLRRMLQVFLGSRFSVEEGSPVRVRRDEDIVSVAFDLGAEGPPATDVERAWLSRMAIRFGGRYEVEGRVARLTLVADGVSERNERTALRKELDEAKRQGAAYAQELAQLFEAAAERPSSLPPASAAFAPSEVSPWMHAVSTDVGAWLKRAEIALEGLGSAPGSEAMSALIDEMQGWVRAPAWAAEPAPSGRPNEFDQVLETELKRISFAIKSKHLTQTTTERIALPSKWTSHDSPLLRSDTGRLIRVLLSEAVRAAKRGSELAVRVRLNVDALQLEIVDEPESITERPGELLLQSGTAKTSRSRLAYQLAEHYGTRVGASLALHESENVRRTRFHATVTFAL